MSNESPTNFRVSIHWALQLFLLVLCIPVIWGLIYLLTKMLAAISVAGSIEIVFLLVFLWFLVSFAFSAIEVSHSTISLHAPFGTTSINWDDVEIITQNGELFTIQTKGRKKHLSVSMEIAGKGKKEFYEFINKRIESERIIVQKQSKR